MKILELFSGYGTATFALKKLGINHEIIGYSDIDRYANQCFEQNHNLGHKPLALGDVRNINPHELKNFDLLTGGFPCQAFSVAGKGLGELDPRGTLFNEIIRIAEVKKPKYMLLENVKGLLSKKFEDTFKKILGELDRIGYFVEWKVLNTKQHGIPQNRDRVFFVCFRKDLSRTASEFEFPELEELKIFLDDILEKDVDEKYFLSEEKTEKLLSTVNWDKVTKDLNKIGNVNPSGRGQNGNVYYGDVSPTITTNKGEGVKMAIACITPDRIEKRQNGRRFKNYQEPMFTINTQDKHGILQINNPRHSNDRVYLPEGISPTLNTMQGGDRQPFILIKNATKRGYLLAVPGDGISLEHPNSETRRDRVQPQISPTLQCNDSNGVITYDLRIRKLTPKECFRLQGFLKDEVNLEGLSNTQQYKLAGNGQSVNVVAKIFENMFGLSQKGTNASEVEDE